MTRKNVSGVLAAAVANNATFNAAYPAGTARGDYFGAYQHQILVGQSAYNAPNRIALVFNAANITVTNKSGGAWPIGESYTLSLDIPGAGSGWLTNDGRAVAPKVQDWPTVYFNLGSPLLIDPAGLRVAAAVATPTLNLLKTNLDVPRNITIAASADVTGITFVVKSNDVNGYPVTENFVGAGIGTVTGKKAHYTNITITPSAAPPGNISVGWGSQLGLPAFLPSAAFVQKELMDGAVAAAGAFTFGDQNPATGITGDVRGTYLPASAPDGLKAYGILVCMPDPGYQGADQFAA